MTHTLALTLDETTARYGLPNGVGHDVMTPVVTLDGDHIGSGTMTLVCTGKPLDAGRAERKFLGDKMCTRCDKWEATDGFRDAHAHAMAMLEDAESGESVADMIASAPGAVIVTATGTTVVDADAPAVRPVTADDARDAVKRSKGANRKARKGAAVDAERERLTRQTRVNGERVITVPGADAPAGPVPDAVDAFVADLYAPDNSPEPGRPLASEAGRKEFVWADAVGEGADMIAVSALGDVVSGGDHVYVVWSGGMWHAGDAVPMIDATYYGQGESPDDAVKIVLHKRAVVADYERADREESGTALPGDVDASTPGNTDRVTAALEATRERVSRAALDALGADVVASLSSNVLSPNARAAELRDAQSGVAAKRPVQARAWARITDGKCAVVVSADELEDGTGADADGNVTVTLSGRMRLDKATAVAALCGGNVIPVGKTSGALAPQGGSDADGVHGVCPVCHMEVSLTNSGAVGTHRPDGSTPDAPQLSQREIPAVDTHGEATRDAAKKRDAEAYRDDVAVTVDVMAPVSKQVAAVLAAVAGNADAPGVKAVRVPVVDAGATDGERERRTTGIKGGRNQGRSDGVAMVPLGESGYAGVKFDDGRGSTDENGKAIRADGPMSEVDPIKGGPFGTVRESVYNAMSASARRRYRAKVAHNRAVWEAGRDKRKAERAERGMPRSDMRAARKAASIGSSRQGHTYSHHMSTKDTDVTVTVVGSDVTRSGRDWSDGK